MDLETGAFGLSFLKSFVPTRFGKRIIDLSIGEPNLSTFSSETLRALSRVKNVHRYYPSHGDPGLRDLIRKKFYHLLDAKNILITHGAIGAIDIILRSLASPDAEILLPDPGFPPYEQLARFSGYKIRRYSIQLGYETAAAYDWKEINHLVNSRTRIILFNSPHNPSGKLFGAHDKAQLKKLLNKYPKLSFVMDEVYRELIYGDHSYTCLSEFIDRGYLVGSFSKMFPLQGARIGWVTTHPDQATKLSPYLANAYGAISSFGQEMAKYLLKKNISFRDKYVKARKYTEDRLTESGLNFIRPLGGFYFFIDFGTDDFSVAEKLNRMGVLIIPGSKFGKMGKGFIRICFASSETDLDHAIRALKKVWKETRPEIKLC